MYAASCANVSFVSFPPSFSLKCLLIANKYPSDHNVVTSKAGSEVILKCLLGREAEIDVDSLPWGEEDISQGIETIVEATAVPRRSNVKEVIVTREGGRKEVVVKQEPLD